MQSPLHLSILLLSSGKIVVKLHKLAEKSLEPLFIFLFQNWFSHMNNWKHWCFCIPQQLLFTLNSSLPSESKVFQSEFHSKQVNLNSNLKSWITTLNQNQFVCKGSFCSLSTLSTRSFKLGDLFLKWKKENFLWPEAFLEICFVICHISLFLYPVQNLGPSEAGKISSPKGPLCKFCHNKRDTLQSAHLLSLSLVHYISASMVTLWVQFLWEASVCRSVWQQASADPWFLVSKTAGHVETCVILKQILGSEPL